MIFKCFCSVIMQHPVCLQMGVAFVCILNRDPLLPRILIFVRWARPPALPLLCNDFQVFLLRYNATRGERQRAGRAPGIFLGHF